MNRILFCLAPLALTLCFAGAASANTVTDCDDIEALGNALSGAYGGVIDEAVAGTRHRINRRKTLQIHGIERVWFEDCTARVDLDVTLQRRIRRNAHGTIRVAADVRLVSVDWGRREASVCIYSPRVSRVRLSRTTRLGEAIYRWVADMALPRGGCDTFTF